ncbi:restriction endonuclease subunit S [Pedobacter ureilyticus]|uniref:Restriction endonuclease subunit S n=1 Tax=Pedobacter ureilyticus TaxID=1393051 RepID=A0ABW9J525_9SPHI|nr:restriction endonuclease subunit S [Pedobacter helvus]
MSYKRLGDYIQQVNQRNKDLEVDTLLGVSITKKLIPSIANTIGTDMSTYKIIERGQFAYGTITSRNGDKISIALASEHDSALVSQIYVVFEVIDANVLLPEYLMMWFSRPEFDRYARYHSHGSTREAFDWEDMCEVELPIPSIEKQREIVAQYQAVANKIKVNEQICEKLEATAQALYQHWFVDFEFPDENGNPYKSASGKMVYNEELEKEIPEEWDVVKLEEVSSLKYGKMLDSDKFLTKGYPVFSGYGIRGYYSEFMYQEPQILVLCRGVSGTGEVKLSPNNAYITNLSIVVEMTESLMTKYFSFYFLKNDDLRTLDSGSAQSMITTGDLYFRNILKPLYYVQQQFDEKVIQILEMKKVIKAEIRKLTQLQNILLSRLATLNNKKTIT